MRAYAQSKGWWDGKSQFNFATVYSYQTTARIEASGSRYCEGKKLLEKSNGLLMHTSLYTTWIVSVRLLSLFMHTSMSFTEGHITAETMMDILRDKDSGINMEGMFMSTGSMVSVIPTNPALPAVHYFTATPDPER